MQPNSLLHSSVKDQSAACSSCLRHMRAQPLSPLCSLSTCTRLKQNLVCRSPEVTPKYTPCLSCGNKFLQPRACALHLELLLSGVSPQCSPVLRCAKFHVMLLGLKAGWGLPCWWILSPFYYHCFTSRNF